jgi:hypothetical protein
VTESVAKPLVKLEDEVIPEDLGLKHNELQLLGDRSDMPGRNFKYSIELGNIEINWDSQAGEGKVPDKYASYYKYQVRIINKWRRTVKT